MFEEVKMSELTADMHAAGRTVYSCRGSWSRTVNWVSYTVRVKILYPYSFLDFVLRKLKNLKPYLHAYSAFKSTPNYKVSLSYSSVWWGYAI